MVFACNLMPLVLTFLSLCVRPQGSLFRERDQEHSFCPSYRFITDLSKVQRSAVAASVKLTSSPGVQNWAYTALPGAVSGRRFSGIYMDFSFFRGLYKTVRA